VYNGEARRRIASEAGNSAARGYFSPQFVENPAQVPLDVRTGKRRLITMQYMLLIHDNESELQALEIGFVNKMYQQQNIC
jgi:hypothetical protein